MTDSEDSQQQPAPRERGLFELQAMDKFLLDPRRVPCLRSSLMTGLIAGVFSCAASLIITSMPSLPGSFVR